MTAVPAKMVVHTEGPGTDNNQSCLQVPLNTFAKGHSSTKDHMPVAMSKTSMKALTTAIACAWYCTAGGCEGHPQLALLADIHQVG